MQKQRTWRQSIPGLVSHTDKDAIAATALENNTPWLGSASLEECENLYLELWTARETHTRDETLSAVVDGVVKELFPRYDLPIIPIGVPQHDWGLAISRLDGMQIYGPRIAREKANEVLESERYGVPERARLAAHDPASVVLDPALLWGNLVGASVYKLSVRSFWEEGVEYDPLDAHDPALVPEGWYLDHPLVFSHALGVIGDFLGVQRLFEFGAPGEHDLQHQVRFLSSYLDQSKRTVEAFFWEEAESGAVLDDGSLGRGVGRRIVEEHSVLLNTLNGLYNQVWREADAGEDRVQLFSEVVIGSTPRDLAYPS